MESNHWVCFISHRFEVCAPHQWRSSTLWRYKFVFCLFYHMMCIWNQQFINILSIQTCFTTSIHLQNMNIFLKWQIVFHVQVIMKFWYKYGTMMPYFQTSNLCLCSSSIYWVHYILQWIFFIWGYCTVSSSIKLSLLINAIVQHWHSLRKREW